MKISSFFTAFAFVAILFLAVPRANAVSDIGFKAIGFKLGYVDPEGGLDGAVEFGAAAEFGEFAKQLHWDGSISYWSTGRDYPYYDGNIYRNYNWKLSDLIFRTGINYHFVTGEWEPYVGGGLGLHFYSWDYAGAPTFADNSDSKFALYIDGGIEHRFSSRWTGQAQVNLDFAEPDQTAVLFNLLYSLTPARYPVRITR